MLAHKVLTLASGRLDAKEAASARAYAAAIAARYDHKQGLAELRKEMKLPDQQMNDTQFNTMVCAYIDIREHRSGNNSLSEMWRRFYGRDHSKLWEAILNYYVGRTYYELGRQDLARVSLHNVLTACKSIPRTGLNPEERTQLAAILTDTAWYWRRCGRRDMAVRSIHAFNKVDVSAVPQSVRSQWQARQKEALAEDAVPDQDRRPTTR